MVRIVKKAYFDGSAHESGFLVLAGMAFPESIVGDFEVKWGEILDSYGLKWWHTPDAMNRQPDSPRDFLKDQNAPWSLALAEAAMDELGAVTARFWHQHGLDGFQLVTCCVNLADHKRATENNKLMRSAEAICVDNTAGYISLPEEGVALLYFDRTENFMKEIEQVWRKDRAGRWVDEWPHQIACISAVNSRLVRPIQAADLVAWQFNLSSRLGPVIGPTGFNGMGRVHHYYGLAQIEADYTREKERDRAEGIRRAGRKTRETAELEKLEAAERQAQEKRPDAI